MTSSEGDVVLVPAPPPHVLRSLPADVQTYFRQALEERATQTGRRRREDGDVGDGNRGIDTAEAVDLTRSVHENPLPPPKHRRKQANPTKRCVDGTSKTSNATRVSHQATAPAPKAKRTSSTVDGQVKRNASTSSTAAAKQPHKGGRQKNARRRVAPEEWVFDTDREDEEEEEEERNDDSNDDAVALPNSSSSSAAPPITRRPSLKQLTIDDLVRLFERDVTCFGKTARLRDMCNFDVGDVHRTFCHRGVTFAMAVEQAFKSALIMALAAAASVTRRPVLLVVGLRQHSVKELDTKLKHTLTAFGVKTLFLSNANDAWQRFRDDSRAVGAFKRGRLLLVTPGYAMARASVLDEVDVRGALLIMDESDVIFSRDQWSAGSKEHTLARLIAKPQAQDARVTGVVLVSATHLSDFHLWGRVMKEAPKQFVSVNTDLLREHGFTTHEDMELLDTVSMAEVHKNTQYGIKTDSFRFLMRDFVTCPGRNKLLLVASCPYVNSGDCTLLTQASAVLDEDPGALVVVHHNGKSYLRYREGPHGEPEPREQRVTMKRFDDVRRAKRDVETISDAVRLVQHRFCSGYTCGRGGAVRDRRIVVVAYHALTRSTSARTDDRVPTHIFVALGRGRTTADVHQTLMRPAGKCTDVRRANGHDKVKVVTTEEDWEMLHTLPKLQQFIARETERDPHFDFESFREYGIDVAPTIASTRAQVPRQMRGCQLDWSVDATPEEWEARKRRQQQEKTECDARKRRALNLNQHLDDSAEKEGHDGEHENDRVTNDAVQRDDETDNNKEKDDGEAEDEHDVFREETESDGIGGFEPASVTLEHRNRADGGDDVRGSDKEEGAVGDTATKFLEALMKTEHGTIPTRGMSAFALDAAGVDINRDHHFTIRVLRDRGFISAAGQNFVAILPAGRAYVMSRMSSQKVT